jgi:hypothetical protein
MAESDTGPSRRRTETPRDATHAIERKGQDRADTPGLRSNREATAADAPVHEDGRAVTLFPQRLARKYYVTQAAHGADERRVYADERGEYLVFKDQGHRLTTRRHEGVVVRDLVAIAVHRDWSALRVSGSEPFRRQVWLEASVSGIEVSGYAPSQLDREALARRDRERKRGSNRKDPGRGTVGVRGEQGGASLQVGHSAETRQAFDASARDRSGNGAAVQADRSVVDASHRNRGRATIERDPHRNLPSERAIEDARWAAAYSQIAALERAMHRAFPENATVRDVVLRAARERVAFHLEQGRDLHRATYRLPSREKSRQPGASEDRDAARSDDRRRLSQRDRER